MASASSTPVSRSRIIFFMCVPFLFDGLTTVRHHTGASSVIHRAHSRLCCVDKIYDKAFYQERKFFTYTRRVACIPNDYSILEMLTSPHTEIDLHYPFRTSLQHLKMAVYAQAACTSFGVSTSTCGSESHGRASPDSVPDLARTATSIRLRNIPQQAAAKSVTLCSTVVIRQPRPNRLRILS